MTRQKTIPQPKNEFAPTIIRSGDKDVEVIEPAPAPTPSPESQRALDLKEFLEYVNGDLRQEAAKLGYEVVVKKITAAQHAPKMYYNIKTHKGKVFTSEDDAILAGYMSGEQMQEIWEQERAETERAKED